MRKEHLTKQIKRLRGLREGGSEEAVFESRSGEGTEEIPRQWGKVLALSIHVACLLTVFIRPF